MSELAREPATPRSTNARTGAAAEATAESYDAVVLGLGYVGLPLAQQAIRAGMSVLGFDVSPAVVEALGAGRSHVDDLSDADVAEMLAGGFRTTVDETRIAAADVAVICVPTPLSEGDGPDLRAVTGATEAIGRNLRPGMLVVLESTTYPGTTDDVVRPLLERLSGLVAGRDFHLAFSPERIDPGNERFGARNTPKVVGGYTTACTERVAAFYGRFVDTVVRTRGTREAETPTVPEIHDLPDLQLIDIVLWTSQDDKPAYRRPGQGARWVTRPIGQHVAADELRPVPITGAE